MTILDPPTDHKALDDLIESAVAPGTNGDDVKSVVQFPMVDSEHVPTARYYSREFFELEKKYLWPHVWQMAAREEEIPDPGDYVEYEIVGNSFLIIRQPDGTIKALSNACRHRGTELGKGSGRFPGNQIVCPFHGWRWKTDGVCNRVFGREGFSDNVLAEDLKLPEAKVETWSGHVWINRDLDAEPLRKSLFPAAELLDRVGVGNMRVKWWKETIVNCNWKLAQEAFFEGYHVMQTHPQIYMFTQQEEDERDLLALEYTAFQNGHGRFQAGDTAESFGGGLSFDSHMDFMEFARLIQSGQDAMQLERDVHVFETVAGDTDTKSPEFMEKAIAALYEHWKKANIPVPEAVAENMKLWGGDVHVFPNYLMLPQYANSLAYRVRPHNDDPDWCKFEVWSLTTYPVGAEPERAELAGRYDKDDADNWGLIPRQDFANLERMQRGVKDNSLKEIRLSEKWEKTISNMHEELDRRLAAQIKARTSNEQR